MCSSDLFMVSDYSDAGAAGWLDGEGIALLRGSGRLAGTGVVEVDGVRHTAEHVVLANGAEPVIPPIPGLGELDGLFADLRSAGLPVELRVEGATREVPAGTSLCAYRIIQEALTNTLKHAGSAGAEVLVRYARETHSKSRSATRGSVIVQSLPLQGRVSMGCVSASRFSAGCSVPARGVMAATWYPRARLPL